MKQLEGMRIIVTGGSGLLGRAIVKELSERGADVINLDINDSFEEIGQFLKCDITNDQDIENAFKTIETQWGYLDGLVNNAYPRTLDWGEKFEDISWSSWRKNIDIQLNTAAFLIQKFLPLMKKSKFASIVNIASIYGVVGNDFNIYEDTNINPPAAYSAIKGGLINFTRFLASFYGEQGIRANCVSPGGIFDHQPESFVKKYEQKVPMKRMGKPDDISPAVCFLLSADAKYITGQNLIVDGGWTII